MPKWSQHRPRAGSGDLGLRDAGVSDSVDAGDHSAVAPDWLLRAQSALGGSILVPTNCLSCEELNSSVF